MCSGSEAGSYSRLTDFVYHSTLGLRGINKKKRRNLVRFLFSRRSGEAVFFVEVGGSLAVTVAGFSLKLVFPPSRVLG